MNQKDDCTEEVGESRKNVNRCVICEVEIGGQGFETCGNVSCISKHLMEVMKTRGASRSDCLWCGEPTGECGPDCENNGDGGGSRDDEGLQEFNSTRGVGR